MSGSWRAYVLGPHDAGEWARAHGAGLASSEMPFGSECLRDCGFSVQYASLFSSRLTRRFSGPARRLHRRVGRPVLEPIIAVLQARQPELFVSFFEDNAPALAVIFRCLPGAKPRRRVVIVCWLSEELIQADEHRLARAKRALASFDLVVAFSENQRQLLVEDLGLSAGSVAIVPFGVDPDAFAPRGDEVEDWALSVGGDIGRDFVTLAKAVAISATPCRLVAPPHRTEGLDLPEHLHNLGAATYSEYLGLLHRAQFVVIPSHPLAYPTGQTVLLEAMMAGKACVVTDTPAIRDYVRHDDTALLVPPHSPEALAQAMSRLQEDPALRTRLGAAARRTARQEFTTKVMWRSIVAAVRQQGVVASSCA